MAKTYIAARDRRRQWCGALSINDVDIYPADAKLELVPRTCGYGEEWLDESDETYEPLRSMTAGTFERETGIRLEPGKKIEVELA